MFTINTVNGSKATCLHSFVLQLDTANAMNLQLEPGEYWLQGKLMAQTTEVAEIVIPVETFNAMYDIWITKLSDGSTGVEVVQHNVDDMNVPLPDDTPIDRVGWLMVPANCIDLTNARIDVVRMVDTNAS